MALALSSRILQLLSAGLVEKWFREEHQRLKHEQAMGRSDRVVDEIDDCEQRTSIPDGSNDMQHMDTKRALRLHDIRGILYVWAVGVGISVLVFLVELGYHRAKKTRVINAGDD